MSNRIVVIGNSYMKIKQNDLLEDDCKLIYKVLGVVGTAVLVENFPNPGDLAGEVISMQTIKNEGWKVVGSLKETV